MIRSLMIGLAIAATPVAALAETAAPTTVAQATPAPTQAASDPCAPILNVVNRPTVTTTACVVKPNKAMIETGYQNTSFDGAGNNLVTYPRAFLRVGTKVPNLEFDLTPPSYAKQFGIKGATDVAFGVKYQLGSTDKFVYSVNGGVSAPTGTNGFSAGGTVYDGSLNASYALNSVFSLAGSANFLSQPSVNPATNATTRFRSFQPSLLLTAALPSDTQIFGEVSSLSNANGPGTKTATLYDVGVMHALGKKAVVDLEFGRSPTAATGKYRYVGFGFSYSP